MKINEAIDEIDRTKYWKALLTVEDHSGSNPHLTVIEKVSNFIVLNFDCSYHNGHAITLFTMPFEEGNQIGKTAWQELQKVLVIIGKLVNTPAEERI